MGEVASALGADETAVSEALTARNAYSAEHLDWHSDDEGEHPRAFAVEDREFDRIENRLVLASVIGRLPHRERRILILRFEHEMTQAVIAEHLQISQMHVSRLLGTALARLRQLLAQAPDTAVARSDPDRPT